MKQNVLFFANFVARMSVFIGIIGCFVSFVCLLGISNCDCNSPKEFERRMTTFLIVLMTTIVLLFWQSIVKYVTKVDLIRGTEFCLRIGGRDYPVHLNEPPLVVLFF